MPKEKIWLPVCLFTLGVQIVNKTVSLGKLKTYKERTASGEVASYLYKYTPNYKWHVVVVLVVVHLTNIHSTFVAFPLCVSCAVYCPQLDDSSHFLLPLSLSSSHVVYLWVAYQPCSNTLTASRNPWKLSPWNREVLSHTGNNMDFRQKQTDF